MRQNQSERRVTCQSLEQNLSEFPQTYQKKTTNQYEIIMGSQQWPLKKIKIGPREVTYIFRHPIHQIRLETYLTLEETYRNKLAKGLFLVSTNYFDKKCCRTSTKWVSNPEKNNKPLTDVSVLVDRGKGAHAPHPFQKDSRAGEGPIFARQVSKILSWISGHQPLPLFFVSRVRKLRIQ